MSNKINFRSVSKKISITEPYNKLIGDSSDRNSYQIIPDPGFFGFSIIPLSRTKQTILEKINVGKSRDGSYYKANFKPFLFDKSKVIDMMSYRAKVYKHALNLKLDNNDQNPDNLVLRNTVNLDHTIDLDYRQLTPSSLYLGTGIVDVSGKLSNAPTTPPADPDAEPDPNNYTTGDPTENTSIGSLKLDLSTHNDPDSEPESNITEDDTTVEINNQLIDYDFQFAFSYEHLPLETIISANFYAVNDDFLVRLFRNYQSQTINLNNIDYSYNDLFQYQFTKNLSNRREDLKLKYDESFLSNGNLNFDLADFEFLVDTPFNLNDFQVVVPQIYNYILILPSFSVRNLQTIKPIFYPYDTDPGTQDDIDFNDLFYSENWNYTLNYVDGTTKNYTGSFPIPEDDETNDQFRQRMVDYIQSFSIFMKDYYETLKEDALDNFSNYEWIQDPKNKYYRVKDLTASIQLILNENYERG